MRILFLLFFISTSVVLNAQISDVMYVAAKTGLSMREKPEAGAKVMEKIPYGAKVNIINAEEMWLPIVTEGMNGYWRRVKFNNQTGYVVDAYLFNVPPPKLAVVKEMKQYLAQLSQPFGAKLVVKSGSTSQLNEGGWELRKQLYKNGAEWHEALGYEYGSNTYFIPGFTVQQGFLLLRLIPAFNHIIGEKDEFTSVSKKIKKGEIEYDIKVEKLTEDASWINKITISYEEGAYYTLEIYQTDFQLVVHFNSGL
ncbi:MAG: hypothetical protein RIR12_1000 [Bacteroidota bacterium]|jgi:hypothetical protein